MNAGQAFITPFPKPFNGIIGLQRRGLRKDEKKKALFMGSLSVPYHSAWN